MVFFRDHLQCQKVILKHILSVCSLKGGEDQGAIMPVKNYAVMCSYLILRYSLEVLFSLKGSRRTRWRKLAILKEQGRLDMRKY